jgi:hypothetical protein
MLKIIVSRINTEAIDGWQTKSFFIVPLCNVTLNLSHRKGLGYGESQDKNLLPD